MAQLTVTSKDLVVTLSAGEKIAALHRDLRIPLDAIESVRVVADSLGAVRGLRAPGLALPGLTRIGTWRRPAGRSFVVAHRAQKGLHITLRDHRLTDLVIAVPAAEAVQREVSSALDRRRAVAETDVVFVSAGLGLAGTYAAPRDRQPLAVALIVPGSGEVDRDSDHSRLPLGVSADLAHALAAHGIASLRYDKRGVGRSEGSFLKTGLRDNVDDARAALAWLRTQSPAASRPAFLVGHSEGGMIVEALAAGDEDLSGVVLLAAPGVPGLEMMAWQTRQVASALPPFARMVVRLLRLDLAKLQQKSVQRIQASTTDTLRMNFQKVNARWQRELLDFDPVPFLARITAPVLAITGEKDLQVDVEDLETIRDTVAGPVEVHRAKDLTHLLRTDPDRPNLGAYSRLIRRPTDAALLERVASWIVERARAKV
ncbi:MAG: alpha/beta fold hydrolase [Micrococcus sp.]|nr:alpha/beta fold hydrolase [Micrococcus sp.]